ncbi:respiratory nitrate reductase subunit gamma [Archaeoglobus sp.]
MIWLQALVYFSFTVFVLVVLAKVVKYATMPIHLRWELYPVPHEKGRAEHGGSYFEEADWWKKPRETTLIGELKDMFMEMLFIKRVFEHKRPLWWFTYPFHTGIYLILTWFALVFIGAIFEIAGFPISAASVQQLGFLSWLSPLIYYLTWIVGVLAMALMLIFGLGLLFRRLGDEGMRSYSAPVDYFNLLFIIAVVATGIAAWQYDGDFAVARAFMKSLITFSPLPSISGATILHVTLLSLLFLYLPFTKMTHFFGKYFTYHKVLWEDEPNLRGGEIEKEVKKVLRYRISWSAPHMKPGMTWADEVLKVSPNEIDVWKKEEK